MYGDLSWNSGGKLRVVLVVGAAENSCRIDGLICRASVLTSFYWTLSGFGPGYGGAMPGSGLLGK